MFFRTFRRGLNIIMINIVPIFEYPLSDRAALNTSFGSISYTKVWGDYKERQINASIFSGLTLGFRYYF